jgi:hypothetical protein
MLGFFAHFAELFAHFAVKRLISCKSVKILTAKFAKERRKERKGRALLIFLEVEDHAGAHEEIMLAALSDVHV